VSRILNAAKRHLRCIQIFASQDIKNNNNAADSYRIELNTRQTNPKQRNALAAKVPDQMKNPASEVGTSVVLETRPSAPKPVYLMGCSFFIV
jgi:hypothetical protein